MKISKNLHWSIYLLFTLSCAKQTSPTGGPKDTIPPILVKSHPEQEQINYKGKTIDLVFSEMVILDNPKEQIIITPTTDSKYETIQKNNKVTIKFEESLKDSTTYTINFREAVKDITEKNPAKNLQLAFSTGKSIDSLSISGSTYNLLKGVPLKEIIIALFQSNDTMNIFKHKPYYITKSDKEGKFALTHIKHGAYYLYALNDKNKNLVVDSKNEAYGFKASPIVLTKDTTNLSIPLVNLDARPLKVSSARPYNTYYTIKTTKKLTDFNLKSTTTKDSLISSFGEDEAIINVYNTFSNIDSLQISLTANDSIGNSIDTTLILKFGTRKVEKEKYAYDIKDPNLLKDINQLSFQLTFNKPTWFVLADSLYIRTDSAQFELISDEDMQWNKSNTIVHVAKKIKPESITEKNPEESKGPKFKKYLYMGKGAFISIENDSIKQTKRDIKTYTSDQLGIIKVSIQTKEANFIVELLDKNEKVIKLTRSKPEITWDNIQPGDYKLRVTIDSNNNGKWDPGNYFKKEEPEVVLYYQGEKKNTTISLKQNWELGPLLITF